MAAESDRGAGKNPPKSQVLLFNLLWEITMKLRNHCEVEFFHFASFISLRKNHYEAEF